MKLNKIRDRIHENAVNKGFYQVENEIDQIGVDNRTAIKHAYFAQKIALICSELSDALEADRKNYHADLVEFGEHELYDDTQYKDYFDCAVKNTVEDELADAIIRILDLCGWLRIDIETHISLKMKYNELREYKHGKNY
jgi:NTP pyrophosphatase (non-canonical NTP hydrolase)